MYPSPAGLRLLMQREGVRLRAYADVRGIWTIGVGHTSMAGPPRVWPWSRITDDEAFALFAKDVMPYAQAVTRALYKSISQTCFDACVSLCYNIGEGGFAASAVAKSINAGNMQEAADDFMLFNHPPSLLQRRESERTQFLKGI